LTDQTQPTALDQIMGLLAEPGFDGLAQVVTVLLNEAMKSKRAHALAIRRCRAHVVRARHNARRDSERLRPINVLWPGLPTPPPVGPQLAIEEVEGMPREAVQAKG
jgi:hypothetical protein